MRLKAEMEEMKKEARKRQKAALANGEKEVATYYEGIMLAMDWVRDKKDENTFIFWSHDK